MRYVPIKPALKSGAPARVALLISAVVLLAAGAPAQTPVAKAVGTVKSISGNSVVLTTGNGSETTLTFADSARIVRATPGQTDLKTAPSLQLSDIQVGDRIAARGQAGEGNSVVASAAIVMKQSDIAQRQQRERDEWRHGVGGIVKEVNAAGGTITIANALIASGKPIIVHLSQETAIRRYAPDSIKFDDAKPGSLEQIKPGDQLRARGTKTADGTEFTAQAIVSGAFQDIAGTVISTDAPSNNITIMDLATKKPVVVKVSADSQLRKLPQFVAMGIAMRLKGGAPGAPARAQGGAPGSWTGGGQGNGRGAGNTSGTSGADGVENKGGQGSGSGGGAPGMQGGPAGNWRGAGGGPPDFQQMLNRMPTVSISELNKGDAVMLVATEGSSNSGPTAITLLAGVEPILSAAPAGTNASTILSPWNLGAPASVGGDASTP
jgi:hypothetical protein